MSATWINGKRGERARNRRAQEKKFHDAMCADLHKKYSHVGIEKRAHIVERDMILDLLQEALTFIDAAGRNAMACDNAEERAATLRRKLGLVRNGPLGKRF